MENRKIISTPLHVNEHCKNLIEKDEAKKQPFFTLLDSIINRFNKNADAVEKILDANYPIQNDLKEQLKTQSKQGK